MADITSKALGFPNITKMEGWFWSAVIVLLFCNIFMYYYKDYFGIVPVWDRGAQIALIGAIMTQIAIIPAGYSASLTFLGQKQEVTWGDGVSPIPNIFHITLGLFHFSVLWGLLLWKEHLHEHAHRDNYVRGDIQKATFGHRTQITPVQMGLIQLLTWFFTGWREGLPHLWFSNLGFRVMLIGIAISFGGAGAQKISTTANSQISNFVANGTNMVGANISVVTAQLNQGSSPIIPSKESYSIQNETNVRYFERIEGDNRKYFLYHRADQGKVSSVTIRESSCVLIPFGMTLMIYTKYPPLYAHNMEHDIVYTQKGSASNHLPIYEQLWHKVVTLNTALPDRSATSTWTSLFLSWNEVRTDNPPIQVRAIPEGNAQPESNGGLVCF